MSMNTIKDVFSFMKGNVLVMTLCECVWRSTIDIIWPFLSLYILELGGNYKNIGFIMAAGNLASMIFYPIGGYIADYQGRIKLIGYMTFAYGSAFLINAFTDTWQWLGIGMFFQSLVTFYFPARQALIADSLPPEKRGIGFASTVAIPSAFGIAAPYAGGWLIEKFGLRITMKSLYFSGFFIAAAVALFRLKYLKETIINPKKLEIHIETMPWLFIESYRSLFRVLNEIPRKLFTLSYLVSSSIFFASLTSSFWVIRAYEVIGINVQQWGTIMLVFGLVSVLAGIPIGGLIDRSNKKWIAGICLFLSGIQCLIFLTCKSYHHLIIFSALASLTNSFMNPSFQSLFANLTPREKRGRVLSSIGGGGIWLMRGAWGSGILGKIMQTLGSFFSGYLYSYNKTAPWIIVAISLMIIGILFLILVKEPDYAEL